MKSIKLGIATLTAAVTLGGCSTTPERNAALDDIRGDFDRLARKQEVQRFAGERLQEAEQAVQRAEQAWQNDRDKDVIEHYIYLAERRLDIAEEAAALGRAEQVVQNAAKERQQILSELRQTAPNNATLSQREDLNEPDHGYTSRSDSTSKPLEQDLAELETQLTALDARRSEEGLILSLENMVFVPDDAALDASYDRTLDEIAELLKDYPGYPLHIRSTTGEGTTPYDLDLAEQRARAIEEALISRGVPRERFSRSPSNAGDSVAAQPGSVQRPPDSAVEIVIEVPVEETLSGL